MGADHMGWVVAVINQASGTIEDTLASQMLHSTRDDALWERDIHAGEAKQGGRHDRYAVCEVTLGDRGE